MWPRDLRLYNTSQFSAGIRIYKIISACEERNPLKPSQSSAALHRLLITEMGMKFKVLIQRKGNIEKKLLGVRL
jgi:SAM-dependent MidA family methyltransferase